MSDTIVDNYKINLKTQTARIEFLNSRNTYGDKDFLRCCLQSKGGLCRREFLKSCSVSPLTNMLEKFF